MSVTLSKVRVNLMSITFIPGIRVDTFALGISLHLRISYLSSFFTLVGSLSSMSSKMLSAAIRSLVSIK